MRALFWRADMFRGEDAPPIYRTATKQTLKVDERRGVKLTPGENAFVTGRGPQSLMRRDESAGRVVA